MNAGVGRTIPRANPQAPVPSPERTDRRVLINTGALATSSLWRIGISFVLQLLIAGRLGAEGLGQYTTALAYLNVCQVLSELGLPQLLVRDLARMPQRRRRYFRAVLIVQVGAALAIWTGMSALLLVLPYAPTTRLSMIVITASLPFFAVTSACETFFQAGERMELVMGVEVTVNTLIVAVSLLVLHVGGAVPHLAAVIIGVQTVSALLCLFLLRRSRLLTGRANGDATSVRRLVRLLLARSRPFYGLALANVLLQRLDVLLLNLLAGDVVTGIYGVAYLVVRVFIVLSEKFWQALYPTLSRLRRQSADQYRRLAALGIRYGLMALLPVAVLGRFLFAPILALIYAGDHYNAALVVVQVLVWAAPLFFVAVYSVNLLLVEHMPRRSLLIAGVHIAVVALLLPPLTARGSAVGAAAAVIIAVSASTIVGLSMLRRARIPTGLSWRLWPLAAIAGLSGLTVYLVGRWLAVEATVWFVLAIAGVLLYATLLWKSRVVSVADVDLFRKALQP